MAASDELTEGTINKPKNTALHNRLEQNSVAKAKSNLRYASPPVPLLPLSRPVLPLFNQDANSDKSESKSHTQTSSREGTRPKHPTSGSQVRVGSGAQVLRQLHYGLKPATPHHRMRKGERNLE